MDVRLLAYRRETTASDTYDTTEYELDLQRNPDVVVNYNWLDLKNPDKRKSSFSQTLKLPFSNRNNDFFENYFDVNLDNLVYSSKRKFQAILYVDSIPQLKGFIQLKSIFLNARLYEIALFGGTADFFTDLKDNKLRDAFIQEDDTVTDLYLLSKILDHKLTLNNIVNSWTLPGLTTVLGTTTNDVMYPIIDWGHTAIPYSDSMFWSPSDIWTVTQELGGDLNNAINEYAMIRASDLKPSIRIQRLLHIIAAKAGYTIKSDFLGIDGDDLVDTSFFSRLFMTLSTESTRVQTLFNTSGGSEALFIGFEATQSGSNTSTVLIGSMLIDYVASVFPDLDINSVYDPNNLFGNDLSAFDLPNASFAARPCIQIPLDTGDGESLLPTGDIDVKVTMSITLPGTTGQGNTIAAPLMPCLYWFKYPSELVDWMEVDVGGGGVSATQTIEFTTTLPNEAGAVYFFHFSTFAQEYFPFDDTIDVTINSCTIETLQTENVGLMGGGLNGEVQMRNNMPDITQADFVKDLVNRFNLIIKTDADNEKLLLIEPYQDYIGAGSIKYFTDKLDVSKEQVVKSTNELQSKHLKFSDLESEDILNQRYTAQHNLVYGEYNEFKRNDFAKEQFKNYSVMSPFIAQGMGRFSLNTDTGLAGISGASPTTNVATAYCFKAEKGDPREPLSNTKPMLFYYSGTPVTVTGNNPITGTVYNFHILSTGYVNDTTGAKLTNNKFPLCLQYNLDTLGDITSSTKILNWTYYSPAFNTGFTFNVFGNVYTEKGYYNEYWSQYINEVYSDEARIMDCYLNLDATDILSFAGTGFQDTYYIKNTLWRVISINNYLVGANKSTKVRLLKVIEKLPNDCGAIPTITNTGLMTWVDAGSGASTTITNSCCEEVNSDWTFVQTNDSTGVGDCYADATEFNGNSGGNDPGGANAGTGGIMLGMPSLLPNVETNFNIQSTTALSKAFTFYLQATTLDSSTVANFSYNNIQKQILKFPIPTMNYAKVLITGTIMSGTNAGKCGYFEYDTILVTRTGTIRYVGTAGGTLLKTNKDVAFTTATVNLTNYDSRGYWSPVITGGANETVYWTAKIEMIQQVLGDENYPPAIFALYQNSEGILFQNLNRLEWN